MSLKYGVGLGREMSITEIPSHAKLADELGYDHFTVIDSQNLSRDSVAMMTLAAINTKKIKIGPGVTQTFTRHMAVTSNSIATINELSGGRAFLGLGLGMSSTGVLNQNQRPLVELGNAVKFFHDFTEGRDAEWKGGISHSEWSGRR